MEKFLLTGRCKSGGKLNCLRLPIAKHFDEKDPIVLKILSGENQELNYDYGKSFHPREIPTTFKTELKRFTGSDYMFHSSHHLASPDYLDHIFSKHPSPLAQGPAVPYLDVLQFGSDGKSFHEVFADRTEFAHDESQACQEWFPGAKTGTAVWETSKDQNDPLNYVVRDIVSGIQGAASLRDMSIVYTCTLEHCIIHCLCTVCIEKGPKCRTICGDSPCEECNSQCLEHQLKISRLFDPASDHFTMVTDRIDQLRYVIPYAGIPACCEACTRDVREHQVLHHVFHGRCRFCRFESRPLNYISGGISLQSYKKAAIKVVQKEMKTCAYCLTTLTDSFNRKVHEKTLHEKKNTSYKCGECGRLFTNKTSLKYHEENHRQKIEINCELCGKQFRSHNGLKGHKELLHNSDSANKPAFSCEDCERKKFFENQFEST